MVREPIAKGLGKVSCDTAQRARPETRADELPHWLAGNVLVLLGRDREPANHVLGFDARIPEGGGDKRSVEGGGRVRSGPKGGDEGRG